MSWHHFRRGDLVHIEWLGRKVAGRIRLASPNGQSLMLAFDAMLEGYAGMMPVLWDSAHQLFRDLVKGETACLRPESEIDELREKRNDEPPPRLN